MGFCPTTRIAKTRCSTDFDDNAVCVDEVDRLGTFLALERIVPHDAGGEMVQASWSRSSRTRVLMLSAPSRRTTRWCLLSTTED